MVISWKAQMPSTMAIPIRMRILPPNALTSFQSSPSSVTMTPSTQERIAPLSPAATPKTPMKAVQMTCTPCSGLVRSISRRAGFKPKQYGTMKAAIASEVALSAVFIGLEPAIAPPA